MSQSAELKATETVVVSGKPAKSVDLPSLGETVMMNRRSGSTTASASVSEIISIAGVM